MRDRLNEVFGNDHVIGLGHDVEWPPRSVDLTPYDFFLWGYLKNKVFSRPPEICCARESSKKLMLYDIIVSLLLTQCKIWKTEPRFVLREMGDTLKDKALK